MALSVKNPEADRLAREVARLTGESLTEAVIRSLAERLERERRKRTQESASAVIARIRERLSRAPVLDDRDPDAIIGYDEHGLPGKW
jgi:antitoxin VapB